MAIEVPTAPELRLQLADRLWDEWVDWLFNTGEWMGQQRYRLGLARYGAITISDEGDYIKAAYNKLDNLDYLGRLEALGYTVLRNTEVKEVKTQVPVVSEKFKWQWAPYKMRYTTVVENIIVNTITITAFPQPKEEPTK